MKGLSFSAPMVIAWNEGRKSITRRLMNPQPFKNNANQWLWEWRKDRFIPLYDGSNAVTVPGLARYNPGEMVYIKETWRCDNPAAAQDVYSADGGLFYKAGMSDEELAIMPTKSWKSPRFMPEWAARSHALIKSVKAEQLRQITELDAVMEGFDNLDAFMDYWAELYGEWDFGQWVWVYEPEKMP